MHLKYFNYSAVGRFHLIATGNTRRERRARLTRICLDQVILGHVTSDKDVSKYRVWDWPTTFCMWAAKHPFFTNFIHKASLPLALGAIFVWPKSVVRVLRVSSWRQFEVSTRGVTTGAQFPGRRIIMGVPKNPNNVTSTFFNTVHLLPKDLRCKHGGDI